MTLELATSVGNKFFGIVSDYYITAPAQPSTTVFAVYLDDGYNKLPNVFATFKEDYAKGCRKAVPFSFFLSP